MTTTHETMPPVLSVRDLRVTVGAVPAVRGVSFDVPAGQVTALVGESGAGKSLTARAVLGLAPHGARILGSVRLDGEEIAGSGPAVYRRLWGRRVAYVPQDALAVLSPVHPVGDQLAAAVRSVARVPRAEARARAVAALDAVGIADAARRARALPHEFSGGMRQRAVIAMALINGPRLIVADEPTTALDPRVREQVLDALTRSREATGAALLLITHDLPLATAHADHAVVLYAGRVTETGPARQIFTAPGSPYTAGLVASLPPGWGAGATGVEGGFDGRKPGAPASAPAGGAAAAGPGDRVAGGSARGSDPAGGPAPGGPGAPGAGGAAAGAADVGAGPASVPLPRDPAGPRRDRWLPAIAGAPPSPFEVPAGCAFASRCPMAVGLCREVEPPLEDTGGGRLVACHRGSELPVPATTLFLGPTQPPGEPLS
ncbi:ABC transporter ATP-binding protein [Streptomyces sp. KN37]|uniref:ABC transporter ATP-binding protein n=1 Tax=Streptomyces sp. KN37 TaxID=3090667 RepID=UPI002A75ABC0|nr:ABC transporter ATP-binding protein [Streptomyces sp. KN37]WPO70151.1 ABC transporter ATP-binding protein [Streptomyces sp. KN37]